MNIEGFVNDIERNGWNIFGFEVRHGGTVYSYGDTKDKRHPIYSATKSITSIAVGCAADDGLIELSAPILRYLPDEYIRAMSSEQREMYDRYITVERLMSMSISGYPFRPEGNDWLRFCLDVPVDNAAERSFDYSNIPVYLVCVAASRALGRDLFDYLDERLFTPLEIEKPPYLRSPEGYFYGASGMELTVNELSRVGLMMMNGGVFNGRRILSESYAREAVSVKQPNREGGYGLYFWKYRSGFSINGKFMQKCYVLPDEDIIVTMLSDIVDKIVGIAVRASMERHIIDAR